MNSSAFAGVFGAFTQVSAFFMREPEKVGCQKIRCRAAEGGSAKKYDRDLANRAAPQTTLQHAAGDG
jgi:hypothetical protein